VLDRGRETFGTSALDSDAYEILQMPEDSIWPVMLAAMMTVTFYGLLFGVWWLAILGLVLVILSLAGWCWPTPLREEELDLLPEEG